MNLLIQVPLVGLFFYGFFKIMDRFDEKEKKKDESWQTAIKDMQEDFKHFIEVRDEKAREREERAIEVQKELIKQVQDLSNYSQKK